ncbi:MAG: hypothetical protein MRY83_09675 [Flavobacteriales bacterium]|nr:hypothetical protein [Flavobacteriales bacterium]
MRYFFGKYAWVIFWCLLSLVLLILAFTSRQNAFFKIGAASSLFASLVYLLNSFDVLTKPLRIVVSLVLALGVAGITSLDYKSIKEPVEFENVKDKRFEQVVQYLKDIRAMQLAYKSANGVFTKNFDTLMSFVKYDSMPFVRMVGDRPDTLSEMDALKMGLISRDTILEPVFPNLFTDKYMSERNPRVPFNVDSLPYIPFSGGKMYDMDAGEIVKNNVPVKVFQVVAPNEALFKDQKKRYYEDLKNMQVGSMVDPTTSGNWE